MKYVKFLFLVIVLSLSIQAQENAKQEKPRYAVIPPTDVMLTVAVQPDSPLQIENAKLLYNLSTKRISYSYDLRNRGTKPIVGYISEAWRINGTGGTLSNDWSDSNSILLSGQVAPDDLDEKQIVPLTKELRDELKLSSEMKMLIVLVVRDVFFADGSKYDGNKTTDALVKYFEKVGDCEVFLKDE
jgi:hypothetical protein